MTVAMVTSQSSKSTLTAAVCVRNTTGVLTRPDTLRAEDIIQVGTAIGTRVGPILNSLEHCSVGLVVHIPENRVMEDAQTIVENLVFGNIDVLPGVQYARCNVLDDCRSDLSGRFVENVGKVVLGQQRVSGISAVRISPWFILVFARGINDTCRAGL